MRKIMATLDIGNYLTKLVVGEMTRGKFNVLSTSTTKTLGYEKNNIVNVDDLKNTILTVIKDSEEKLSIPIKKVMVCLASYDMELTIGEAKIKISNEENIITSKDISKVIHESYKGVVPDNMELISSIPTSFKLDNDEVSLNPINKKSSTLALKCVILMAPKKEVYKILSILDELSIDVVDISIDAIGDYYYTKCDKFDKTRVAIINIGEAKTTVSIFNKGLLTNVSTIDLASKNITNDISYIYKVKKEDATKLKEEFALAYPKNALKDSEITIKDKNDKDITINELEISKIVYSRLKEILEVANKEINVLTRNKVSYIIVTGATSDMKDFDLALNSVFDKNAFVAQVNEIGVRNNKFSSAVGIIKWYNYIQGLKDKDYSIFTIEEQEEFSGVHKESLESDNSVIGRFFSYFLDD